MSTFNVTLKRNVVTVERKTVQIEAADQDQAGQLAQQFAEQEPSGWSETDACEAEIGDTVVESCTLHAFSETSDAA